MISILGFPLPIDILSYFMQFDQGSRTKYYLEFVVDHMRNISYVFRYKTNDCT